MKEAHARGMKIMLDAVFNHIGYDSPQWQDVVKYRGGFDLQGLVPYQRVPCLLRKSVEQSRLVLPCFLLLRAICLSSIRLILR